MGAAATLSMNLVSRGYRVTVNQSISYGPLHHGQKAGGALWAPPEGVVPDGAGSN